MADVLPVGGPVAGTGETLGIDEGLHEHRAVGVALLPMFGQGAGSQSKNLGGEILRADPGQDQEAGVVDDEVEVSRALRVAPADIVIARRALPSAGAESKQGEELFAGGNEIAQLCPGQCRIAEVVLAVDVFIPQLRVGALAHRHQLQRW